jgi:hypothetical protein
MKTSETVEELALYSNDCCGEELIFDEGDTFCRCPKCKQLCEWEPVEALVRWNENGTEEEEKEEVVA